MKQKKKKLFSLLAILATIALWSVALHYISPIEIVEMIGVENGYLVMFAVSLLGGMTSFGGAAYVATAITLAAGGLSPLFLASAAMVGTTIGDTIFFVVSHHSKEYFAHTALGDKVHRLGSGFQNSQKSF